MSGYSITYLVEDECSQGYHYRYQKDCGEESRLKDVADNFATGKKQHAGEKQKK